MLQIKAPLRDVQQDPPCGVCARCGQEKYTFAPLCWECEEEGGTEVDELIVVKQLPIIEEHLHALKEHWEQRALDAETMVCTVDIVQAVKGFRAGMRKEFDDVEALRKKIKKAVLEPYEQFEKVYQDCVTAAFQRADTAYARKISEVESDIKSRCEENLRDYFAELCAFHHLDWLTYERAGIKVDMASAKAETPKKLMEQFAAFVAGVAESVDRINTLEDAAEIMVEYQRSLDAAGAICTVKERHRRIEEQQRFAEDRNALRAREDAMVRRVEALAAPVVVEVPKTVKCTFTVHTTMDKLKKLKEFLNMEGIQYE